MKHIRLLTVSVLFSLAACTSNNSQKQESAETPTGSEKPTTAPPMDTSTCYRAISGKDSILLHITTKGNAIEGELVYSFFEKDNNRGNLKGQMSGDTIIANYTFQSEGQTSVREVAFLRKGNALLEGTGPVKEVAGKMVFENKNTLTFNGSLNYQPEDCKPDEHGCITLMGYQWSSLKKDCLRPSETGVRLNAGAEASSKAKPAYILWSADKQQAELFLPGLPNSVLLQSQGKEGKQHWENGQWKLYPWKGFVLKQNDKVAYAGQ